MTVERSISYKCDRCGEGVTIRASTMEASEVRGWSFIEYKKYIRKNKSTYPESEFHLCETCGFQFEKFMKRER